MIDLKEITLRSEDEIISSWNDAKRAVVTVFCPTYNHEECLDYAIRGILIQETTFPFEVLIHDDASTDMTVELIKVYQEKYPRIIKSILQVENQFSKRGLNIFSMLATEAKGDYIAVCEGDDYWFDSKKLCKQVGFLNAYPDYVLHVYNCFEMHGLELDVNSDKQLRLGIIPGDYSPEELKEKYILLPVTSCFRNPFGGGYPNYFSRSINNDRLIQLLLAYKGKARVSGEKVAVYRLHEGGIWSQQKAMYRFYERAHSDLVCAKYLADNGDVAIQEKYLVELLFFIFRKFGYKRTALIFIKRLAEKPALLFSRLGIATRRGSR